MNFRGKARISRIAEVITFIGALLSLDRLANDSYGGHATVWPMISLIAFVCLGCIAVIYAGYYAARARNYNAVSEKLAVEILAKLGQQQNQLSRSKQSKKHSA